MHIANTRTLSFARINGQQARSGHAIRKGTDRKMMEGGGEEGRNRPGPSKTAKGLVPRLLLFLVDKNTT